MKPLHKIIERQDFYRINFKKLVNILLISLLLNIILIGTIFFLYKKTSTIKYFAVNNQGEMTELKNRFHITPEIISNWTTQALSNLYNIDFLNYREELTQRQKYFTEDGWEGFLSAYNKTLKQIKAKKLVSRSVITSPPVVIASGNINGIKAWKVQTAITIFYKNETKQEQGHYIITVLLKRTGESTNNQQILGITQLIQQNDQEK